MWVEKLCPVYRGFIAMSGSSDQIGRVVRAPECEFNH